MVDYPEVGDLSLKIINRLNKENIKVVILTKSILPDELLNTKKINEYGITLVSLDENFRKKYEPFTPSYQERIKALKKLHDAGFYTWVSIEPYPTPNICDQDFKDILNSISFVDYIVFGRLHYNKQVSEYKGYKEFFNECASFVSDFCQKNNIKFHIKKGTSSE
jgi:DNA repair photolyase